MKRRIAPIAALALAVVGPQTAAFAPPSTSRIGLSPSTPCTTTYTHNNRPHGPSNRRSSTSLSVLGSDGILGVGAPEIAVTLLVGYFVLGPSDLYKLVKEIGKFVQNFRTLGAEAATAFEGTMENQLELTELRKAQAELNDAFSFRRSINTDELGEAFEGNSFSENSAVATAAGAATATASDGSQVAVEEGTPVKKKRRLVRRKKKKAVEDMDVPPEESVLQEYPDLDLLDTDLPDNGAAPASSGDDRDSEEEKMRSERLERLGGSADSPATSEPDWFTAPEEDIASAVLDQQPPKNPALEAYEKERFQSQLSAEDWNAQVMANEDKLSPLSMVMQRLAILEEEKNAADKRLEEEYQRRMDNEDKFYLEKRRALEGAIADIQEGAFAGSGEEDGAKEENKEEEMSNATKFTA
ncbi:hypothetical protein ACHAXT_012999 [Thalassiosira profunda]